MLVPPTGSIKVHISQITNRGYLASLMPAAARLLDDTFHAWVLANQRASFPPSTVMEAPEMKDA